MIITAERAGMGANLAVRRRKVVLGEAMGVPHAMKLAAMIEVRMRPVEVVVAMDERSTVGDVSVVVVNDGSVMPVSSPVAS